MSEGRLEEWIVPYVRGELDPLEEQWVAARIDGSESLRRRVASVRAAFDAVASYEPTLDNDHRARLLERLSSAGPRASERRGRGWIPLVAGGLGVALALGFVLGRGEVEGGAVLPVATSVEFSDFDDVVELEIDAQQRAEVHANLRTVVSPDWVGRVEPGPRETQVRVDAGTIAFGFRGGNGRRLEVSTVHARVVVVGTRFSVGVSPDGRSTRVEVSQGRVQVWRGRKRIDVQAGEVAMVSEERAMVKRGAVADVLDDPYLVAVTGQKSARRRAKARDFSDLEPRTERNADAADTVAAPRSGGAPAHIDDRLELLERADAAARRGDLVDALSLYAGVITESESQMVRNMAKLGRARALGRAGQLRLALAELEALTSVAGEVGRQAELSRCEVRRRFQPCDALRCFEALSDVEDRQLAKEAERIAMSSRRAGLNCEASR